MESPSRGNADRASECETISSRIDAGAPGHLSRCWAEVRQRLLSIPDREILVATRGFDVRDARVASHLEEIGRAFVAGYNRAVGTVSLDDLHSFLEGYAPPHRGFAYEGASMGLAVADFMTPFSGLWRQFAQTAAESHIYMAYVGYGWSLARLPVAPMRAVMRLQQPIRWLAMDGFGFHQGYFHWPIYIRDARRPRRFSGYASRAFDQGLGRSLWFVQGADPDRVARAVERFSPERASDLWAGVGLAATYAGGATPSALDRLRFLAGSYLPHVAQGAAFAARARWRAGNPVDHTERACGYFCGLSLENAAQVVRDCLPADSTGGTQEEEPYEIWRARVRKRFGAES